MDFCREGLRLQLVGELREFVDIDSRPESKGMRDRLRCGMASGSGGLADAGANYSIYRFAKGNAALSRATFQQFREVIVEGQSRPHHQVQRRTAPPVMPPSITSSAPVM